MGCWRPLNSRPYRPLVEPLKEPLEDPFKGILESLGSYLEGRGTYEVVIVKSYRYHNPN